MKTEEINYKRFKDVEASPRDKSWGTTVTAAGMEHIANTKELYEESHAGCKFNENGRNVLNEYRLIYITRGAGYFESASYSKVKLTAGMMAMLFPGEWHSFHPDKECGWDCYWVGFNGINIDNKIRNSFFAFRHCIYRLGVDDKVISTLQEILDAESGYEYLTEDDRTIMQGMVDRKIKCGHACFGETAKVYHFRPETIRLDGIAEESGDSIHRFDAFKENGINTHFAWMGDYPNSYHGDNDYILNERIAKAFTERRISKLAETFRFLKNETISDEYFKEWRPKQK